MSRDISATNLAEINASHLHEVVMVKLEFDTPIYVHSGVGTITYDSNDYLGVGDLGAIGSARESSKLGPLPIELQLSAISSTHISEGLDSGNYGDVITVYIGYRQDDGTLVDDPWIAWKGTYEYAGISLGQNNVVSITCQHDLAVLNDSNGSKFTDEDQQQRFSGDAGFEFVADAVSGAGSIIWGGGPTYIGQGNSDGIPWWKDPEYYRQ